MGVILCDRYGRPHRSAMPEHEGSHPGMVPWRPAPTPAPLLQRRVLERDLAS